MKNCQWFLALRYRYDLQILVWVSVQENIGDGLEKYKLTVCSSKQNGSKARPSVIHTLD
jgi:hypothetical protein